jgi:hypothetical protein
MAMRVFGSGGLGVGTAAATDPGNGVVNATTGYKVASVEYPMAANGIVKRTGTYAYSAATGGQGAGDFVSAPGGSNGQVQFNSAGVFSGNQKLAYDTTTAAYIVEAGNLVFTDVATHTRKFAFNASSVTAGQQRTITIPDSDVTLSPTKITVLTGNGTFTTNTATRAMWVELIAGGGGGGGAKGSATPTCMAAGGGAGGGYVAQYITTPAATYAYVAGAGGAGGLATPAAGTAGTNTTFGATLTATGGGGGAIGTAASALAIGGIAGSGVSGSGGQTIALISSDGGTGLIFSGSIGFSGGGGGAPKGGGNTVGKAAAGAGLTGAQYGGGGSGALSISVTGVAGGNGANGVIMVTEFF